MIGQTAGILALPGMLVLPLAMLAAVTRAGQRFRPTGHRHHYWAGAR